MSLPHLIPDTHVLIHIILQRHTSQHIQALAGDLTAKPCSTRQGLKCVPAGPLHASVGTRKTVNMAPTVAGYTR
jgi:hypothetical protein